jgi:hypothetical protein
MKVGRNGTTEKSVKIALLTVSLNRPLRTWDACCFKHFHHFPRCQRVRIRACRRHGRTRSDAVGLSRTWSVSVGRGRTQLLCVVVHVFSLYFMQEK